MATITKRGKRWRAQVRLLGHPPLSGTFATKGEAQAWATHTESDILAGTLTVGTRKTLRQAIQRYLEEVTPTHRGAVKEAQNFAALLNRLPFVDAPVSSITTPMIAEWRDSLAKEVKPGTVIKYLGHVNSVMEVARREWQWIDVNPCKDVKRPRNSKHRDGIFTQQQIDDLAAVLPETAKAVFLFAIETAMRRGEILGLEWRDVNLERRFLTLQTTKNGDKRQVPLSSRACEILRGRIGESRPFDIAVECLRPQLAKGFKAAGIEGMRLHDARHTACTFMAQKVDVLTLARILGHRDLRSLSIYYNKPASEIADLLD
ncbi:MAG: site-specific integrase [Methylobacter sp.]|uniref:tyrosine-type recombinase/integrase n=1 Tax=Methylobacter sp. TaxID=2051955 RepID=UPI0025F4C811|nr:site-specific integrase [Methylobacter sp.]MCK9622163.1 site-specific integrase [Methylobacter sp.]